jgi:lipoate-protein ligase A
VQERPSWSWLVLPPQPLTAHEHMALDEVLLGRVASGGREPTLRFWRWTERALVLGSHQSVANEVDAAAAAELGFTITRRMSGGGTMLCEPGGTITWSLYAPASFVAGMSFVDSFRFLDAPAVEALRGLRVDASYRPINDIVSPRGKIAGAAQARRAAVLLHHTTLAYAMEPGLVRRVIRVGRERVNERGVRSADKQVSPLSWFTSASLDEVVAALRAAFGGVDGELTPAELDEARALVTSKYATEAWLLRLP